MLTTDCTTNALEYVIGQRALELFTSVYGLTWADSFDLAAYERTFGPEHADRVARLISQSGCTFLEAEAAVQSVDQLLAA